MSFNSFLGKAVEGVDFDTRFREYSEETNWSNGEVVQRGTGSNYGQDGFLRPGFPYREGIDYLHSKVIEYRETGQNVDDILSRDWKNKFAAALIPRGVEHNDVFTIALRNKWHDEVFKRFMEDIEKETFSDSAKEQIRAAGVSRSVGDLSIRDFWSVIDTIAESFDVLKEEHAFICKRVDMICDQLIEFAQGASSRDERVSSELKHQYKPVDSIVDDFAVEAQNFANSLVQSSAFGAGAIAINLLDTTIGSVVAALVGALNIIIAFGTMTNISRYRNRNEEARLHFADNVLAEVEKSVFSLLPDEKKFEARLDANPYYRQLEKAATIMLDHMKYYDIANKDEFELEYNALKKARFSVAAVATFDSIVVKKFLPDTFHVNSYVQEQLVNIHRVCNEIMKFEKTAHYGAEEAEKLYTNMIKFKPRLENSLQRGAIRWGFLKRRKFAHWDITICFRYFLGLFFRKNVVREVGCAPIQVETARLAYALQNISKMNGGGFFSREVIELNTAYWATRESEIASLVFVSAFFVFIASIIFTIGRIFSIIPLIDAVSNDLGQHSLLPLALFGMLTRLSNPHIGNLGSYSQHVWCSTCSVPSDPQDLSSFGPTLQASLQVVHNKRLQQKGLGRADFGYEAADSVDTASARSCFASSRTFSIKHCLHGGVYEPIPVAAASGWYRHLVGYCLGSLLFLCRVLGSLQPSHRARCLRLPALFKRDR